jgi:hypothetical protein
MGLVLAQCSASRLRLHRKAYEPVPPFNDTIQLSRIDVSLYGL